MIPVSVGICAYEEEKNIGRLLNFLHNLKLRRFKIIEIIVVASGCRDRTVDIVKEFNSIDNRIKLVVQKKREGKSSAFNLILKRYKTNFLVYIDADCKVSKNSLQILLDRIVADNKVGVVTGIPVPIGSKTIAEKITQFIFDLYSVSQSYFSLTKGLCHINGEFFVMRRGICERLPVDVVNEDGYIGAQCRFKGYRILMENKAKVYFKAPKAISDLITQRRRFLYGHFVVRKKTRVFPPVLELSLPIDQGKIILEFLKKRWYKIHYFLLACLLELYTFILVGIDMLKKENPHVIWKVARTTKL